MNEMSTVSVDVHQRAAMSVHHPLFRGGTRVPTNGNGQYNTLSRSANWTRFAHTANSLSVSQGRDGTVRFSV